MTDLSMEQLSKVITGRKRPTMWENLEQLSKKEAEGMKQMLADSDKEFEEYVKGLEESERTASDKEFEEYVKGLKESERTAAASKHKSAAGPSSGFKPHKVAKPKAQKPRKLPIEEVIARLTQVAEHDPEARKKLEKIWYGP